jgi:DNA-binding LacI/PurR family transcriptional regulator/DNA-binding transcriptional regulator YhcF (GntR family)
MSHSTLTSTIRLGRPAERQELIVQELREQIVGGQLPPGSRLPTRDEIGQKYGAGANTVQRALDRLRVDGFILSSGRNGTYVSSEPPHLTRYAIVFPAVPTQAEKWVRFWTALNNEALRLQRQEDRKLPLYYGVDGDPNSENYQTLLQDVFAHRVAGIIFASNPYNLCGTPILDEPGIPRIGIMAPSDGINMPAISTDVKSFFDKALDYLQRRDRRKVAFINPPGMVALNRTLLQDIADRGMMTQPFWNQSVHLAYPQAARDITHLMMHISQSKRPDALVVSDDNLVEYATAGLVAAGVHVPDDVEVVAHCNFPWPTPSVVPVQRLGFDAREVLQAAIKYIDAARRGESEPLEIRIPARFEHEVLEQA